MGCTVSDWQRNEITTARAAGWSFSRAGQTFSSGCSAFKAQWREAQSFNSSRYAAQVAAQEAKIENARLAEIERIAEIARLELVARNDQFALEIWTNIDNQRIAKQQAEIKRLELVAQAQIQADINAENLRIKECIGSGFKKC